MTSCLDRMLAIVVAGVSTCGVVHAEEDPPGRVGRVADMAGEVRTLGADGGWTSLLRNQPLSTGDRVTTDPTGRATLQVGSTVLRVGADTELVVTQMDDRHVRIRFVHGQLEVRVRTEDIPGELFIDTDEGAWVPHHAGQYRFDRPLRGTLGAQAWTGDMLLEAPDSSLPVKAGQRVEVWRAGPRQTTNYRLTPPARDAFGDWALAQDKADDASAAASAAAQVPFEMTGAAELARFGAWGVGPGGEHVWTPAKLPAGWQPYQQGAWAWLAPRGWTWVDDQPWGFAPFHYGRWLQLKGRWAWTPGQWGARRPVYAPALVGWFGGPALAVDGAPAIGWLPLAPDEAFHPGYAVSPAGWAALNDASLAAAARRVPAMPQGRARVLPSGPAGYAHRALPGAAMVVRADALAPGAPVAMMAAPPAAQRRKLLAADQWAKVVALPPPAAPAGRGALSPTAPAISLPVGR
jgi:hypothetical protein